MNYFIFGLQRSGTNFLEEIMKKNFRGTRYNRQKKCWKHSITVPWDYDISLPTILLYKNPYTWIESLCDRNKVDWLRTQKNYPADKSTNIDMIAGANKFDVTVLAKAYRDWHKNWKEFKCDSRYFVRYERLLSPTDCDIILKEISSKYDVNVVKAWNIPKIGQVSQSRDYSMERQEYYIKMQPTILTDIQIEAITKIITPELITDIGYDPL